MLGMMAIGKMSCTMRNVTLCKTRLPTKALMKAEIRPGITSVLACENRPDAWLFRTPRGLRHQRSPPKQHLDEINCAAQVFGAYVVALVALLLWKPPWLVVVGTGVVVENLPYPSVLAAALRGRNRQSENS